MRLLKFNEFSSLMETYVFESKKSVSDWKQSMVDVYTTQFPRGDWTSYIGSGEEKGKKEEIFRARFGTVDSKENVEKFLTLNRIKFNNFKEADPNSSITGKYQSFEFTVDQETIIGNTQRIKKLIPGVLYFVVNWEYDLKGQVVIAGKKSFTPNDLGLAGDTLFYNDQVVLARELINRVKEKTDDSKAIILIEDITKAILEYRTSKFNSVSDILEGSEKLSPYTIPYTPSLDYGDIEDTTLSLIKNNIGEIFGGIFMFNLFETYKIGVNFPESASFKLVDFFFDGMGVSSKAGAGAKPSGSGYTDMIINSMKNHKWEPVNREKEFYDSFVIPISLPKQIGIFVSGDQVFSSTVWMLSNGFSNSSTIWNTLQKLSGINLSNKINRDLLISAIDSLKGKPELIKLIKEIKENAGRGLNAIKNKDVVKFINSTNITEATALLNDFDSYTKIGIVIYYSAKQLSEHINQNWSDELNSLINRSIKYQQLYMDLDINKNTIVFNLKSMANSKFQIGGLNNLQQWTNNQVKISMTK